ncbi:MAG: response regulator [Nevskiaceae bacterium]|nr:MAG: response regulator [Nevskiaceae bacterium]
MNPFKRHIDAAGEHEKTALVVDDSRSARYAMRKLLESHAYTVDTAESAQDAYVYLQRRQPSVIFLDHQMPGCDGLDMLRELQRSPDTHDIPIVICSADEDDAFRQRVHDAGAFGVLAKPPHAEYITALLRELEGPAAGPVTTGQRRTPEIGRPRIAPGFTSALPAPAPLAPLPGPVAAAAEADSSEHRIAALEQEVAVLRHALAARPTVTAESLLPELRAALEPALQPIIEAQVQATVRRALADLAQHLTDEFAGEPPR